MNDIELTQNLQKIAKLLDEKGHYEQADRLSEMIVKLAQDDSNKIDFSENYFLEDYKGNLYFKYNNEDFKVPVKDTTINIKDKTFKLYFDPDNKKFFWYNDQGKKPQALLIDDEGKIIEPRSKRYDLWKQIGGRGLFGDWRLPNLNKIIPLEPFIRKKVIPEIARPLREVGDVLRPVTRTITDPLGKAGEQLGIQTPGRKTPEQSALEETFGKAEDRSTQKVEEPKSKVPEKKPKGLNIRLEDIQTPGDLLFWAMATTLNITYDGYFITDNPKYYNERNKPVISDKINKLRTSDYVKKKNPLIERFAPEALSLLDTYVTKYNPKSNIVTKSESGIEEKNTSNLEMSQKPTDTLKNDFTDFGSNISGNDPF